MFKIGFQISSGDGAQGALQIVEKVADRDVGARHRAFDAQVPVHMLQVLLYKRLVGKGTGGEIVFRINRNQTLRSVSLKMWALASLPVARKV